MKKRYLVLILFIFISMLFCVNNVYSNSFGMLGNVKKYVITVFPNKDGSINMEYHIQLETTCQNVDYVSVRLPQGTPSINYYNESVISNYNFSYRQINFNLVKDYSKGSNINLDFTINLENVYKYNFKNSILNYRITIGEVKNFYNDEITVNWLKNGVFFQGRGKENDNYYVWKQKYSIFRAFNVMVQYKDYKFDISTNGKKFDITDCINNYWLFIVGGFVILIEIKRNIENKKAARFPLRTKNII